jgi:hypothetical protein
LDDFYHAIRNRLNESGLHLALLRQQLDDNQIADATSNLAKIEEDLPILHDELEKRWGVCSHMPKLGLEEL